jgi:hypothetical protein
VQDRGRPTPAALATLPDSIGVALHLLSFLMRKAEDLELQETTQTTKIVSRMVAYRLQFAGTRSCLAESTCGVHNLFLQRAAVFLSTIRP